jgi:hypothetical protein
MESNITHDVEARLRNIESHLGIGNVDEETGEYTVDEPETAPTKADEPETDEPEEQGVV